MAVQPIVDERHELIDFTEAGIVAQLRIYATFGAVKTFGKQEFFRFFNDLDGSKISWKWPVGGRDGILLWCGAFRAAHEGPK